jgi:hypothetical protein
MVDRVEDAADNEHGDCEFKHQAEESERQLCDEGDSKENGKNSDENDADNFDEIVVAFHGLRPYVNVVTVGVNWGLRGAGLVLVNFLCNCLRRKDELVEAR